MFLFVLETSQYPSCLSLQEVGFFDCLVGEHPSSGYLFSWFDLSQINKIENFVVIPIFVFRVFRFNQLFIISSYFLS